MISKNTIKLIKSLAIKKNRLKEKLFLVEGDKNVKEVLASGFKVEQLYVTSTFLSQFTEEIKKSVLISEISHTDITQASLLVTPQNSIAICSLPAEKNLPLKLDSTLAIFLDDIQDPGNLGTIIRICDWFGIRQLFCSPGTADVFNPKVIQASMGSFCRVSVWNSTFSEIEKLAERSEIQIMGAFLEGENIYETQLPQGALLVMGNEGNGISSEIEKKISKKIYIPGFSESKNRAESLNVAVATAILCAEIKRQTYFPTYSK